MVYIARTSRGLDKEVVTLGTAPTLEAALKFFPRKIRALGWVVHEKSRYDEHSLSDGNIYSVELTT